MPIRMVCASWSAVACAVFFLPTVSTGAQEPSPESSPPPVAHEPEQDPIEGVHLVRVPTVTGDIVGIPDADLGYSRDRIEWHLPDPEQAYNEASRRAEELRHRIAEEKSNAEGQNRRPEVAGLESELRAAERLMARLDLFRKQQPIRLSLQEVLQRALTHNYRVEAQSYNPAVETTRLVEAEAAFDAVFFTNASRNKLDRPTGSQLMAGDVDNVNIRSGVRKLLPVGTQVSLSYGLDRTKTSLRFQTLNPEYVSTTALEMRQPLMRGFGIDVNRASILVARNNRSISHVAFARSVRDLLQQVEAAYWELVAARRNLVIAARLLAEFEGIYELIEARQVFDVTKVQLAAVRARLETSKADLIRVLQALLDAQDRLISLMNDPGFELASRIEIIPTDWPEPKGIMFDRIAELEAALSNREEIREQELALDNARIAVGVTRNSVLPRFDLLFRTTYSGMGNNADRAIDNMLTTDFIDYFIGVEFEMPIGNRGPRAAELRAQLQRSQAIAQLKAQIEQVMFEVNSAVRNLLSILAQIGPNFESIEATEEEVRSIVARAERKDINTLTTELSARERLAASRRALLQNFVESANAIINLERAKGTLLAHDNVEIVIQDDERPITNN